MNPDYIIACGIVWRKTAAPEAGLELAEGLESTAPRVRTLAAGAVSPEAGGPCMAEILRSGRAKRTRLVQLRPVLDEVSLC